MKKEIYQSVIPCDFEPGNINIFLYRSGNSFTLVDAGIHSEEAWNAFMQSLAEWGFGLSQLDRILLTHHHPDHVGLVSRIQSKRDIPVYIHPEGIPHLRKDEDFHQQRIAFFEKMYAEMGCGQEGAKFMNSIRKVWGDNYGTQIEGELIPLQENGFIQGLEDLQVIEVPGHSHDHLAFYDNREQWLIVGDHLLEHISSNATVEPASDGNRMKTWNMYRDSLEKIMDINVVDIFPGHDQPFQGHRQLIEKRLTRMTEKGERLLDLFGNKELNPYQLALILYAKQLNVQFFWVMSEIIGLLDFLESEEKVEKRCMLGIWFYKCTARR